MKKKLLDILACPIDKHHPLELYECKVQKEEIVEGVLYCTKCTRFFTIQSDIPIMMPDDLRDKSAEIKFLEANQANIPDKILRQAKPWHL